MKRRDYEVELTGAAEGAFAQLDRSEQVLVVGQLEKLKQSPELGQTLGAELAGYRKLYAAKKRLRIIYEIDTGKLIVTVIAIGAREDAAVYRIAEAEAQRRRLHRIK